MEKNCRIICKNISSEHSEHPSLNNYAIALSCITCALVENITVDDQLSLKLALESAKSIMSDYYCPNNNPINTNNEQS